MSGVNLPALFVKEALGEGHTPEDEKVETYGKSFIYEKVAWDDYINGFMTKKELDDCIAAADIRLLCNDDDPAPGDLFYKKYEKTGKAQEDKRKTQSVQTISQRTKGTSSGVSPDETQKQEGS